jgi:hypothetical protein
VSSSPPGDGLSACSPYIRGPPLVSTVVGGASMWVAKRNETSICLLNFPETSGSGEDSDVSAEGGLTDGTRSA